MYPVVEYEALCPLYVAEGGHVEDHPVHVVRVGAHLVTHILQQNHSVNFWTVFFLSKTSAER